MNKRQTFFFLWFLSILISVQAETSAETNHFRYKYGSYFIPISISEFNSANLPCLPIQIGNNTYSFLLDLGFRGQFSFSPQLLEQTEYKKYLRSMKMYGIRGIEYEKKLFEVPEITVGRISFSNPTIHECPEQFSKDSLILKTNKDRTPEESGKIGWELFGNTNLFLDLGNSKIAFCDGLNSLKNQGYPVETFIKTPLFLERGLVEFEAETPIGPLRCMLDTGATWNALNTDKEDNRSIDQVLQEPNNTESYTSFKINRTEFGPITFHRVPMKMPIRIEAILGIEFFDKHLVFLDFSENYIYISKLTN